MKTPSILTEGQRAVLRKLAQEKDLAGEYVLSGGTALAAFHLHHRHSDDLDLFTLHPVDALRMRRFMEGIRRHLKGGDLHISRLYDRHIFVLDLPGTPLKVEFTQYPYAPLRTPAVHDGVRVSSLRDIAADKLAAILDRFEPKDYYDLYALLKRRRTTLHALREDLRRKFHLQANPMELGAAFARARDLPVLPHMVHPVTRDDLSTFFTELARSMRSEVIKE
jgi:predicted nucleotidyltransferase component of viral defense system